MRVKENLLQLKNIFKSLLPQGRNEVLLLLFFVIFYQSYSIFIAYYTSVVDNIDTMYDVYFSFDNPIICQQGYVYMEGHPLMMYFTKPFIYLGDLLAGVVGHYKAKTLFLVLLSTMLISMSIVYVHRYLKEIVGTKGYALLLFTLFYGFTATSLTLAFTPESFTITAFFLNFTIYYFSKQIKEKRDIRFSGNTLFALTLGGVTITNFAKGIIPILFLNQTWRVKIRRIIVISFLFLMVMVWLQLQYDFMGMIQNRIGWNRSLPSTGLFYEKVIDLLFAAPIFFSHIIMTSVNVDGTMMNAISLDFYRHWWQYAFTIIVFSLLLLSGLKNYKNPLVLILLLLVLEDIVIHVLIMYGLRDGFIYGAHWMFFVPFMFGWLYREIKNEKTKKFFLTLVSILFLGMMINNIIELSNFINLAEEYFPAYSSELIHMKQ